MELKIQRESFIQPKNMEHTVIERCRYFVKEFVRCFKEKLKCYYDESMGRIKKNSKTSRLLRKTGGLLMGICVDKVDENICTKIIDLIDSRFHKEKAKKIIYFMDNSKENSNLEEELVIAGVEIFSCMEEQFMKIFNLEWENEIKEIAIDAVERIMNYVESESKRKFNNNFFHFLRLGVLMGKSKGNRKITYNRMTCTTSTIYEKVGLIVPDSKFTFKYYTKSTDVEEYGFRRIFREEVETIVENVRQYEEVKNPGSAYKYILCEMSNIEELCQSIIQEINCGKYSSCLVDQNFNTNDDIQFIQLHQDVSKKIFELLENLEKKVQAHEDDIKLLKEAVFKEKNNSNKLISFDVRHPSSTFTGRKKELMEIKKDLMEEEWKLVVISGLSGIGKTELALQCANDLYSEGYNTLWINAETRETLIKSFYKLCKEINYRIKDNDGSDKDIDKIVRDIFTHFSKDKSIFIFDNSENFLTIVDFLPFEVISKTKPSILIISPTSHWIKNRRVKICEHLLEDFEESEAINFFKSCLDISSDSQDEHIREIVSQLFKFPLALQQFAAYILEKEMTLRNVFPDRSIEITDYIKEYQEKTKSILSSQTFKKMDNDYKKTTFTALQLILDRIKEDENNGDDALEILNIMSFFSSDFIIPKIFLNLIKDISKLGEVISLLKEISIVRQNKTLKIHGLLQTLIRTQIQEDNLKNKQEEEILEKALRLLNYQLENRENTKDCVPHIISVWKYAYKYEKLINEFIIDNTIKQSKNYTTFLHLILEYSTWDVISNIIKVIQLLPPNIKIQIINAKDYDRGKLIHSAVHNGNIDVLKLLIQNGASIYDKKKFGWTALHIAAKRGHENCVKLLLENKATVNAKTGYRFTPLHLATQSGNINIVKVLLEAESDVNIATKQQFTALHFAVKNNNYDIAKVLVKEKLIDINSQTLYKKTPLHLAVDQGNIEMVQLLLDHGADCEIQDINGNSSLYLAEKKKLHHIRKILNPVDV